MSDNLYIICKKCGSDNVYFMNCYGGNRELKSNKPDPEDLQGDYSFVAVCCRDCATLTSTQEFNDYHNQRDDDE